MLGLPSLPVIPQAASLQQQLAAAELLQPALMAGLAEQLGGQGQGVMQGAGQVPRPPPGEDCLRGAGGQTASATCTALDKCTCSMWQPPSASLLQLHMCLSCSRLAGGERAPFQGCLPA